MAYRTLVVTVTEFAENARRIGGDKATVLVADGAGKLRWLEEGYDLVLLFLHPAPDGRAWVDGAGRVVLAVDQVQELALQGAVVFVGACFGLENHDLLDALLAAGARAVIAGPGANYGGMQGVLAGADVLATALRGALQLGLGIRPAWSLARWYAALAVRRNVPGAADALGFELLQPDEQGAAPWLQRAVGWAGGLLALISLALSLVFGSGDFVPLTTFTSSIVPPPDLTHWVKDVQVNGTPIANWWSMPVAVADSDELTVIDWITATTGITFTLVEQWDTGAITLTGWSTATGGSVVTQTGVLTWTVTNSLAGGYGLTKTWQVAAGVWSSSLLTETLTTTASSVQPVSLSHTQPTPVPTASPTAVPTFTPYYTPTGWEALREPVYATPTPCLFNCDPVASEEMAYSIWLPAITRQNRH